MQSTQTPGAILTLAAAICLAPQLPAPPPDSLTAQTLRTYAAPEAEQGVAVDGHHFYPVGNSVIAKYSIAKGTQVDRWDGSADGLIRHLNSCIHDKGRLLCANSNYPEAPMGSSIEVFDAATLDHVRSHSLGLLDEGSITWFDTYRGGYVAGFAHYDGRGGVGFKDHRYSSVVTFDADWRRTGGWLFPSTVVARMAPYSASGGAIGPDGWLYLLGHDRPEMYVMARPSMGPSLIHIATIELEAAGQAFSWAQDASRVVYTIDRKKGLVRSITLPAIAVERRNTLKFE